MEQVKWALEQDLQNVSHAEIGLKLGVTRERIRQICAANNHVTRSSRLQERAEEILAQKAAQAVEREERIKAISRRYIEGAGYEELQVLMGLEGKPVLRVNSKIGWYRSKWPEMFPYRNERKAKTQALSPEELGERERQIAEAWNSGVESDEIASRFGFKNGRSAVASIAKLRYKNPDLFPTRKRVSKGIGRRSLDERRETVSAMWKAGESMQDIARLIGYSDYKSCYNFVFDQRKRFPEMFPPRSRSKNGRTANN